MLGTLTTVLMWGLLVIVGLIAIGSILFFTYDTVATFMKGA